MFLLRMACFLDSVAISFRGIFFSKTVSRAFLIFLLSRQRNALMSLSVSLCCCFFRSWIMQDWARGCGENECFGTLRRYVNSYCDRRMIPAFVSVEMTL